MDHQRWRQDWIGWRGRFRHGLRDVLTRHHQWHRSLLGMLGPTVLLLSLYPWFQYGWSSYATYTGLGLMVAVSIWDLVSPASRRCGPEQCELPAKQP